MRRNAKGRFVVGRFAWDDSELRLSMVCGHGLGVYGRLTRLLWEVRWVESSSC